MGSNEDVELSYYAFLLACLNWCQVKERGDILMKYGFNSVKKCLLVGLILASECLFSGTFSELSLADMKSALQDVDLSRNVYANRESVAEGFKPSDAFLNSPHVVKLGFDPNGKPIFAFKSDNGQTSGMMVYDKANGMISPFILNHSDGSALLTSFQFPTPDAAYFGILAQEPPNFHAQILQSANGEWHVAFRGTGTISDWIENGAQLLGNVPPQYRVADMLSMAMADTTSGTVHYTGHSEGGGEMQYVILKNIERGNLNIEGTGYNSQRLSGKILDSFKPATLEKARSLIAQYRTQNDVVSGWGALGDPLLGSVFELPPAVLGPLQILLGEMYPVGSPVGSAVGLKNMVDLTLDAHSIDLLREAIISEIQRKEKSLIPVDMSVSLPGVSEPGSGTGSGTGANKKPTALNPVKIYGL